MAIDYQSGALIHDWMKKKRENDVNKPIKNVPDGQQQRRDHHHHNHHPCFVSFPGNYRPRILGASDI